jgi:hypothetical protein
MTITINGNGTVTGVSVGGLPDGIVDTDMIAAGAVTAPKRGAGAILQVQAAKTNSRTEMSSTTWAATNLNCNITPATSSNRVIVQVTGDCNTNGVNNDLVLTVFRSIDGGTYNNLGNGTYGFQSARCVGSRLHSAVSIQFIDEPNTTDQVNYKVYIARASGSDGNVEFPVSNGYSYAYIHLLELAT